MPTQQPEQHKLWRFTVEADRIGDDPLIHRVTVTTASGQVYTREGYHPLWELIRILGGSKKKPHRYAAKCGSRPDNQSRRLLDTYAMEKTNARA